MIVCAHQPNFIPYPGLVDKIRESDIFVVRDDVQFTERNFQHRQRFANNSKTGFRWLTIPVVKQLRPIRQINIKLRAEIKSRPWPEFHLGFFTDNYRRSDNYAALIPQIEELYCDPCESLRDFNMRFFSHALLQAGMSVPVVYGSELDLDPTLDETESLIQIVKRLHGTKYLSGRGALTHKNFHRHRFEQEGIELLFQSYEARPYETPWGIVTGNYGYLDRLFWAGEI